MMTMPNQDSNLWHLPSHSHSHSHSPRGTCCQKGSCRCCCRSFGCRERCRREGCCRKGCWRRGVPLKLQMKCYETLHCRSQQQHWLLHLFHGGFPYFTGDFCVLDAMHSLQQLKMSWFLMDNFSPWTYGVSYIHLLHTCFRHPWQRPRLCQKLPLPLYQVWKLRLK